MEIGLGTPRESIRLIRGADDTGTIRLVGNKTGLDHTDKMNATRRGAPPRSAAKIFQATC